jgi:ABC-2 type transport system ATP-binding protein
VATVLSLDGFGLLPQGRTVTLNLQGGQALAIVGPPASGKSRFLRSVIGRDRASQGTALVNGGFAWTEGVAVSRRQTPQSLARRVSGPKKNLAASALGACGLWDLRNTPLSAFSPSQLRLCQLMTTLATPSSLLIVDGDLDAVDPWHYPAVWSAFRERMADGSALVVVTHRADRLPEFNWILGLKNNEIRFAGSPLELRNEVPSEIEVVTQNQSGVRALVEPFHVRIQETEEGVILQAAEGQAVAAKLLLEGYGNVSMQILRTPSLDEALRRRLR